MSRTQANAARAGEGKNQLQSSIKDVHHLVKVKTILLP